MSDRSLELGTILIVDDMPTNLGSVVEFLSESGFKIWVARSGKSALKKVEYSQPDLILLDVLMPEMDGFETCELLKQNPITRDIPVIFMTALDDTENKVKGFNAGAVDYITKPIQHEEVLARVKTHLSIRHLTQKLEAEIVERDRARGELECLAQELEHRVEQRTKALLETNNRLSQEINERKQAQIALQESEHRERQKALQLERSLLQLQQMQSQLIQIEKMSALGQLVAGVAHEINNPVNFIYGNLTYAHNYTQDLIEIVELYQQHYPAPIPEIEEAMESTELPFLKEDLPKILDSMQVGAERIREIVLSLRHFSRHEGFHMKRVNLHQGLDSTLMILNNRLKAKSDRPEIEVIREYDSHLPEVECYGGELNQVFMNIIANAIDAVDEWNDTRTLPQMKAHPTRIVIRTEVSGKNQVTIRISDNGPGMSEAVRGCIFNPFFTTKPPGKGTGIGLSITWQIVVEKHKGNLRCTSAPNQGTIFEVEIPISHQVGVLSLSA
ncbi:response regulator [Laspinema sp. A4]|uniref:hybrid sensor histidine kinase/response regulator n=1 Tax=Laspinema sp. D2d TaxID=2953686 RepID=UPI0021BAC310|nr:response regulator [Laspinema sp. D2d]MCT7983855.1 response regulator [Laspinema sp. D2d]